MGAPRTGCEPGGRGQPWHGGGQRVPLPHAGVSPSSTTVAAQMTRRDLGTAGVPAVGDQGTGSGGQRSSAKGFRQPRDSVPHSCPSAPLCHAVLCCAVGHSLAKNRGICPRRPLVCPVQSSLEGASRWGLLPLSAPAPAYARFPWAQRAPGTWGCRRRWSRHWHQHACPVVGTGHQHSQCTDLALVSSRATSATCICPPHVWRRIYFIIWRKAFTANKRAN